MENEPAQAAPHRVFAAILAGGASRRMGQDKASLRLDGTVTLLERTARLAASAMGSPSHVLIVGRESVGLDPGLQGGVVCLPDESPGLGPLGGLITALAYADAAVLLLACDMPALSAESLTWILGQWDSRNAGPRHDPQSAGLAASLDGEIEPLFSVYAPGCLPIARTRLQAGRRSLRGLIAEAGFPQVAVPARLSAALANLNTPQDLEDYRRRSWSVAKP